VRPKHFIRWKFAAVLSALLAFPVVLCSCYSAQPFQGGEGEKNPKNYSLELPDEYYFEVKVKDSSLFGTTTTVYALSEGDGWIYMKLGYDREQYVYKPVSEGRYVEYKYDTNKKKYVATMISDALQQQIDLGNVPIDSVTVGRESIDAKLSTLDTYICGYKTLTDSLAYSGSDECSGVSCNKFSGWVNTFFVKSTYDYWIDPVTGLAMRMVNKTRTVFITTTRRMDVENYSTQANIPDVG